MPMPHKEGAIVQKPYESYYSVEMFFNSPHGRTTDMLNVTAYLDESQHTDPRHAVVAGFCGDCEQWKGLISDWRPALGKKKALHMSELRWNGTAGERRIKPLLERLGPIPLKNRLFPVYGAVKVSDYADLLKGKPEFEKKVCGYIVCLSVVLAKLNQRVVGHAKIKIVCERQDQYEPLARALFESFGNIVGKDPRNPYFSSIEYIDKDSCMLTQPADFLSFAMGKYLDERGSRKDLWCRPIFNGHDPKTVPGHLYGREQARRKITEIIRLSIEHRKGYLFRSSAAR
jgi:hypothetical protein